MKSRRQERALQQYLDQLLRDKIDDSAALTDLAPAMPKIIGSSIAKLLDGIEQRVEPAPVLTPPKIELPQKVQVASIPEVIPLPEKVLHAEHVTETHTQRVAPITIEQAIKQFRAQLPHRFQAIVFRVDNLKLALPLHLLGGIQKRDKTITPLPAKPAWFMGLLQHEPDNVQVINTGRYLLGKRYQNDMSDYEFIVVIGNTTWGLACHELYTTIELTSDDIRWFAAAERRPWLAGMLREQMCALLNTDALTLMLQQSLKKAA